MPNNLVCSRCDTFLGSDKNLTECPICGLAIPRIIGNDDEIQEEEEDF